MTGAVRYQVIVGDEISDMGSVGYTDSTFQEITVQTGAVGSALDFGGVTTADIFYLKSDQALTLNVQSSTGTDIPVSADKPLILSGTQITAIYVTNQSGYDAHIKWCIYGDSGGSTAPVDAYGGSTLGIEYTVTSDGYYNGFPGIAKTTNGTLLVVYRKGTAHLGDKGTIVLKTSTDWGMTWSAESTVYSDSTYDARDPGITVLTNGNWIVSYFLYGLTGSTWYGSYTTQSSNNGVSWGTPVAVGGYTTHPGGVSTRVVERAGVLYLATYGDGVGYTLFRSKVMKSVDWGATWTVQGTIAYNAAKDYNEPSIDFLADGTMMAVIRNDTDGYVSTVTSSDLGVSWGSVTNAFIGGGSPELVISPGKSTGLVLYRYQASTQLFCYRWFNGTTWGSELYGDLDSANTKMMYASGIEISSGTFAVVRCMEVSASQANCYFRYIVDGRDTNKLPTIVAGGLQVLGNLVLGTSDGIPAVTPPLRIQADNQAFAGRISGRAVDDAAYLSFYENDGVTLDGSLFAGTARVGLADSAGTELLNVIAGAVGVGTPIPATKFALGTSTGSQMGFHQLSGLVSMVSGHASDPTAIQIPANAIVLGVDVRVLDAPATTANFTVTGTTSTTAFQTGTNVATTINTTDVGTKSCPYYNAAAQTITLTYNAAPTNSVGLVRVTIHYILITAATT